jgi:SulP family sulfate permease
LLLAGLFDELAGIHFLTLVIGAGAIGFLLFSRYYLKPLLRGGGLSENTARIMVRTAPILIMLVVIPLSAFHDFESLGVPLVGHVPSGLPPFSAPNISWHLLEELALPALLIALIGFVESVSVGKTLGAKRRQKIDSNQELLGLGAANAAAALSGGFPVTGGFSRSVVNFDAGADTQMASILTALGITLAALFLTPTLYFLPKAVLAATIIGAVMSLIDWDVVAKARRFALGDFVAVTLTLFVTLVAGVELGVLTGVAVSIGLHLHQTSHPHFAVVGQVPGSEHYRNVMRHDVITHDHILSIRIDESLYFANAAYLEAIVYDQIAAHQNIKHVIIMCPAVNTIDLSALEALGEINLRLIDWGIALHLSEVKGPVMDALGRSSFLQHLSGDVFLSQHVAVATLTATETADLAPT